MPGHRPGFLAMGRDPLPCSVLMLSFCIPAQPQSSRGSRVTHQASGEDFWAHEAEGGPGSGWSRASLGVYTGGGTMGPLSRSCMREATRARGPSGTGVQIFPFVCRCQAWAPGCLYVIQAEALQRLPRVPGCGPGHGVKWGVQSPAPPLSGLATPGLHAFTAR